MSVSATSKRMLKLNSSPKKRPKAPNSILSWSQWGLSWKLSNRSWIKPRQILTRTRSCSFKQKVALVSLSKKRRHFRKSVRRWKQNWLTKKGNSLYRYKKSKGLCNQTKSFRDKTVKLLRKCKRRSRRLISSRGNWMRRLISIFLWSKSSTRLLWLRAKSLVALPIFKVSPERK